MWARAFTGVRKTHLLSPTGHSWRRQRPTSRLARVPLTHRWCVVVEKNPWTNVYWLLQLYFPEEKHHRYSLHNLCKSLCSSPFNICLTRLAHSKACFFLCLEKIFLDGLALIQCRWPPEELVMVLVYLVCGSWLAFFKTRAFILGFFLIVYCNIQIKNVRWKTGVLNTQEPKHGWWVNPSCPFRPWFCTMGTSLNIISELRHPWTTLNQPPASTRVFLKLLWL